MYEYETGQSAGLGMIPLLFILGVYLYLAFTMFKMAQKTGHSDSAWWSFIPILNTFLVFKMASKPAWWFILCLIPIVNIVVFAILWIEVAKACGQSPVWGVLVLIPLINFIALGVLAFSAPPRRLSPTSPSERPRTPTPVA